MTVSVSEVDITIAKPLNAVEGGETVTLCREGVPVAELIQAQPAVNRGPRPLGTLKDKVAEIDPDWWKAMSDQDADDFIDGKS